MSDVIDASNQALRHIVANLIDNYFKTLDGQPAHDLYDMVIREVEFGLLTTVLKQAKGNQSVAAKWLGLARGTLRQRLIEHGHK